MNAKKKTLTAEDALGFRHAADPRISPDGDLIAFALGDTYLSETPLPRARIWVVPATGGDPRPFTSGPGTDTTPRWSPDGKSLAFLSDRSEPGHLQIHLIPREGGEAVQLTHTKGVITSGRGLESPVWTPDGGSLVFLMTNPKTGVEKPREPAPDGVVEFEKSPDFTRLFFVDAETGKIRCVSPEKLQLWEFSVSPDGNECAAVVSDLPFEWSWFMCRLVRFSLKGGDPFPLYQTRRQVSSPVWSPDGRRVAFISSNWSDRGLVGGGAFVVEAPAAGEDSRIGGTATPGKSGQTSGPGDARELQVDQPFSATRLHWGIGGDRIYATGYSDGKCEVAAIEQSTGNRTTLWRDDAVLGEYNWPQFSRDRKGVFVFSREDDKNPRDIWTARKEGGELSWKRITRLHPQAEELLVGEVTEVRWKGADGWDIQGLLIYPPGMSPDGLPAALPMVTVVHGGPAFLHAHQYYPGRGWLQLLAAAGLAVFLPNPRGSTGRGLAFAEANMGDMGGKDWEDIERGIDHCIDEGIADAGRLGVGGWSYGGFMAAWAVTRTNRFRAALAGAGIIDWRSFHGRSSLCAWDSVHFGGADPWKPDEVYVKYSPITHVQNVRTPTLIMHGENDDVIPVEQSHLFYRALKEQGVEVELVLYKDAPHDPKQKNQMKDLGERIPRWFAKHLLGKDKSDDS